MNHKVKRVVGFVLGILIGMPLLLYANPRSPFNLRVVDMVSPSRGTAVDDFNQDGSLDFISIGIDGNAYLFQNDGEGHYSSSTIASDLAGDDGDAASGDLDSDGWPDIVLTNFSQNIYLLINNHDGTFMKNSLPTGYSGLIGVDCGDMNGDGHCDIIVAEYNSQSVRLYFGDGNLQFVAAASATIPISGAEAKSVLVGDFNGDGHMDFVAGQDDDGDPGAAWLFTGDGNTGYSYAGKIYDTNPTDNSGNEHWGSGNGDAFDADGDGTLEVFTGTQLDATSAPGQILFFSDLSAGVFMRVDTLFTMPERSFTRASTPPLDWKKANRMSVVAGQDTAAAVVIDWVVTSLRIGNATCSTDPPYNIDYIPVYLTNVDTVKALDLPLEYFWTEDPIAISFEGTRLAGKPTLIGTIDAPNKRIRIGWASFSAGDVLPPADSITRNIPIAKIMMPECRRQFYSAVDTMTIPLPVNPISLELADKFGNRYVPLFTSDSSWVRSYVPGDGNWDGLCTISDAVFLINYIFAGGSSPFCLFAADANCDGMISISDVVYVINYIFDDGPVPGVDCMCTSTPLGKATPHGNADINISAANDIMQVAATVSGELQAVQLEFAASGAVNDINVTCTDPRFQVFSGWVDGEYRVGVIDLTGKTTLPAGTHDLLRISYSGDGELMLNNAIVVDGDAQEMNVTINRSTGNATLPTEFALNQNQPNPFNPTTDISFSLPKASDVRLVIYNLLGQEVTTLVNEFMAAGVHRATWNSRDEAGRAVASGVYMYRLEAGEFSQTRKMMLLK